MATTPPDGGGRTPAEQLRALGHGAGTAPREDSPRWHLGAAEDAMDEGRWDTARAALQRARESIAPGSPEVGEAAYVALRLAVATVDLRTATSEVLALADRMDAADPVWNRRVRRIVEAAPPVFAASMRAGLLDLLPPLPDPAERRDPEALEIPAFEVPPGGLPLLPDEDAWPVADETSAPAAAATGPLRDSAELPPVPTESPFAAARAARQAAAPPHDPKEDVVVLDPDAFSPSREPEPFSGRVFVPAAGEDLTDAGALRDRLVEEMLARIGEEEGQLLFATATTFLNNGEFETAEIMFSAAMQLPELRVPACEGVMQALVGAGRYAEAVATGARAARIFAREGEALFGIVYWHGVAAQAVGDAAVARSCFARIDATPHRGQFPDLADRMAAVR
ncbi:MAG TPA: hypothetical protein VF746_26385 [Longimicrobium sp.]